ncbi:MAG TPA: DoxX family protein [Gemmatimonadales bacterium]|nr:DoxX family protein [Gemmatimonadales bacterium]
MLKKLLATDHDRATLLIRVALGVVIFAHGAQKVFGWWGGYGLAGTMGFFQSIGIPALFGALAIAADFLGALGVISGALSRIAAFGILCNMLVATALVHWPNGFFMNWSGQQKGEGFEFHILAAAMALYVIIKGGGAASVDGVLAEKV